MCRALSSKIPDGGVGGTCAPVHLVPTLESKRGHGTSGTSSGTSGGGAQSNTRQCRLPPVAAVVVVVPLFTVGLVWCGVVRWRRV